MIARFFRPVMLATALFGWVSTAAAGTVDTAHQRLVRFTGAVIVGPEALAPLLAPGHQIMRANGVGYDRQEYLDTGLGKLSIRPVFSHEEPVVSGDENFMVVRYSLDIEEKVDGEPVKRRAPGLTVFGNIDGQWRVVAHANLSVRS